MSRRGWILFAAMCVIWGIPYLLIKVAVREIGPAELVFVRTGLGAVLLLPIAFARKEVRASLRPWLPLLIYTIIEMGLPWLLLSEAERHLDSSFTGLVIAGVPLVAALLAQLPNRTAAATPATPTAASRAGTSRGATSRGATSRAGTSRGTTSPGTTSVGTTSVGTTSVAATSHRATNRAETSGGEISRAETNGGETRGGEAGRDDRLTAGRVGGLLAGLAGVALLLGFHVGPGGVVPIVELVGVVVCYAIGPLIVEHWLGDVPRYGLAAVSLAVGAALFAPVAVPDLPDLARTVTLRPALAVLALAVVCTALAFVLFFALIAEVGGVRATVITFVNPAVAVVLGAAILGEEITPLTGVAFALILAGSVLATRRKPEKPAAPAPAARAGVG